MILAAIDYNVLSVYYYAKMVKLTDGIKAMG